MEKQQIGEYVMLHCVYNYVVVQEHHKLVLGKYQILEANENIKVKIKL